MNQLIELVKSYELFEQQFPKGSKEDFCRWHLKQVSSSTEEPNIPSEPNYRPLPGVLSRVYRFLYLYGRKAIANMPIDNLEDMNCLWILQHKGETRKSDMVDLMITEFSTGINIINRMLKLGYIEESEDAKDARAKIIRMSAKGEALMRERQPQMAAALEVVFGMLTTDEREQLRTLLAKVDDLHTGLLPQVRNLPMEAIHELLGE